MGQTPITFFKYHGTGNDFVMIDNRDGRIALEITQVKSICKRHLGIGSDGLILIEPSIEADFHMNFYNPDGSQSFCGNGSRCAVAFASYLGHIGSSCSFTAIDGVHKAVVDEVGEVSVLMRDVGSVDQIGEDYFAHTGSPHYIQFLEAIDDLDLIPHARAIRYNDTWAKEGVNVNVVEEIAEDSIKMRTYERGVEDETLSCGTGVTAAALAFALTQDQPNGLVCVHTKGGKLSVALESNNSGYTNIWLRGAATFVFKGELIL